MANDYIEPIEGFVSPWKAVQGLSAEQCVSILTDVANGSSVQVAARNHGTSLLSVVRTRFVSSEFNKAMNEALKLRSEMLEEKAWELAVHGETETTEMINGSVREKTEYPTANLLQFLLKAYHPEKYGIDRKEVRAGPLETPPSVVRSDKDRQKLIDQIEANRTERALKAADEEHEQRVKDSIEPEIILEESFDDLL